MFTKWSVDDVTSYTYTVRALNIQALEPGVSDLTKWLLVKWKVEVRCEQVSMLIWCFSLNQALKNNLVYCSILYKGASFHLSVIDYICTSQKCTWYI